MIISFTGTHSTGKTTLLQKMQNDEEFKHYKFYKQITRKLAREGFSINERGNDQTQYNILHSHYQNLFDDNSNKILDRCYLDGVVYTYYLYKNKQVTKSILKLALQQFKKYICEYDIIFYLTPEFDIKYDGIRSTNTQFRDEIKHIFDMFINKYNITVYSISGNVQQRYSKLKQIIRGKR